MLFGTEDHRARQPPLSSGRLREVDVEREPLGVEGDRARGLLHRLPEHVQEFAPSVHACRRERDVARRHGHVVVTGQRQRRDVEAIQPVHGGVAGRVQGGRRPGDPTLRRDRSAHVLSDDRSQLPEIRAREVVLKVRRVPVSERGRAASTALDGRPADVEPRHGDLRVAEGGVDLRRVEPDVAHSRRSQGQRAVDVVVGECCRTRQQITDGRGDAPRSGQRRVELRVREGHRRIDVVEPSVVGGAQRAAVDVDRDVGIRQRAPEELGDRHVPVATERERRRAGSRAVHVEVPRHRSRVSRIPQPSDIQPLAESFQVDAVNPAISRKAQRLLPGVDRPHGSGADRRAEKRRTRERRVADDERIAELARDAVLERQEALHAWYRHGRRHAAQIDGAGRALESKRKRFVDADRGLCRRHVRTVRQRVRLRHEHRGGRDLPARPHVVGRVAHVHRVRTLKRVDAAREAASELEREVEGDVPGDVRRPVVAIEPAREVQALDVHGARAVPAGHRGVERQMPLRRSAGARQAQIGCELLDRTLD